MAKRNRCTLTSSNPQQFTVFIWPAHSVNRSTVNFRGFTVSHRELKVLCNFLCVSFQIKDDEQCWNTTIVVIVLVNGQHNECTQDLWLHSIVSCLFWRQTNVEISQDLYSLFYCLDCSFKDHLDQTPVLSVVETCYLLI